MDADKFHANCYAHSGAVLAVHYLLRQKPHNVMWGGGYIVIDDNLANVSRTEYLLGISIYENLESFEQNNDDLQNKSYYDKVKFIDDSSALWNRIYVLKEAMEYFDWNSTYSVKYSGYLINHTKKLAIDLADYHNQSKFSDRDGCPMAIDAVPVLTETGGGTQMALFEGVSADSTEELAGQWCADLLQIADELPKEYKLINCCFSEIWNRVKHCYRTYCVNADGCVLSDSSGKLFEGAKLSLFGKREPSSYIKAEVNGNTIKYSYFEAQA
jgi:hypothetical protein